MVRREKWGEEVSTHTQSGRWINWARKFEMQPQFYAHSLSKTKKYTEAHLCNHTHQLLQLLAEGGKQRDTRGELVLLRVELGFDRSYGHLRRLDRVGLAANGGVQRLLGKGELPELQLSTLRATSAVEMAMQAAIGASIDSAQTRKQQRRRQSPL